MPPLISPTDAPALLGVSSATVRNWATIYSEFLSEYARKGRRQYTRRDLAVLRAVKGMLDDRLRHEEVVARLRTMDFGEEDTAPPAEEAPGAPGAASDATSASSQALISLLGNQVVTVQADQAQRVANLETTVADLRERIARLEALVEALRDQVEDLRRQGESLSDQVGSVGVYMHDHAGLARIGLRKPE